MTRSPFPAAPLPGADLMDGLNARFKQLYDAAHFPLTSVGGTANAVTATLDPALDASGLLDGMSLTITWALANSAGVTLSLNGAAPVPVLGADGVALPSGAVGPGLRSVLSYFGGSFYLVSPTLLMGGNAGVRFSWRFTVSGTWTKPDGVTDATPVLIRGWGGGGGGHGTGGAGGGGAYNERWVRAVDLPGSVTVTIGAGGAVGAAGGASTFGAFLTAFGGGRGAVSGSNSLGGGGGGTNGAGANGSTVAGAGGFQGGGTGGDGSVTAGGDAGGLWGGGGGAGGSIGSTASGGRAVLGGGGGGTGAAGGVSLYGGNGGGSGSAGVAPGGGGGRNGAGARGQIEVII